MSWTFLKSQLQLGTTVQGDAIFVRKFAAVLMNENLKFFDDLLQCVT